MTSLLEPQMTPLLQTSVLLARGPDATLTAAKRPMPWHPPQFTHHRGTAREPTQPRTSDVRQQYA